MLYSRKITDLTFRRRRIDNLSIPLSISAATTGDTEGQLEEAIGSWQESRTTLRHQTEVLFDSLDGIGISPK